MEDFKGTKRQLFALQDATGWSVFTERNLICRTHNKPSLTEAKANAQLIAAAPELLGTLLKIQKAINEMDYSEIEGLYNEVEESINKALGKGGIHE